MSDQQPQDGRPAPRPRPVYGLPADPATPSDADGRPAPRPRPVYGLPADPGATPTSTTPIPSPGIPGTPPAPAAPVPSSGPPARSPASAVPGSGSEPAAPVRPPMAVQAVFVLWVAWALVGLAQLALAWQSGALREQFDRTVEQFPELAASGGTSTQELMASTMMVAVVLTVLFEALLVFMAVRLRSGRRWARTSLTVVALLVILLNLPTLTSGGFVGVAVGVAAVVLSWGRSAREYFDRVSPRGAGPLGPGRTF